MRPDVRGVDAAVPELDGEEPLARRMKPWSPLVVAPLVLDMVKTGDIGNTLRLATQAEVERADLPFPGPLRP